MCDCHVIDYNSYYVVLVGKPITIFNAGGSPPGGHVILKCHASNLAVDWPAGKVVARCCAPYKMGCIVADTY